ncbi:cupin fold metalloprotein, WbuC family [bacterium]|nr:MAG: cupin fold metalloprotein, WbuC family [bacterium]
MMRFKRLNAEVLFTQESLTEVSSADIQSLKDHAGKNERKRIRLCAHQVENDKLHEMLIVHQKGAYVRPHKHLNKSEAVHIIEGKADVIIFNDAGNIVNVIEMADYQSGNIFYYRMSEPLYHTLLIHSDILVFHEITNGPFNRKDVVFAPWSPDDNDSTSLSSFMKKIEHMSEPFRDKKE